MIRHEVQRVCEAMAQSTTRLRLVTTTDRADLAAELERLRDEARRARGRVLVVDDEPAAASALARNLIARYGLKVDVANSFDEAKRKLDQPYEAAIIDLYLGDRSGIELAKHAPRSCRVILWSGIVAGEDLIESARAVGAVAILEKPAFDLGEIFAAIRPQEK